MTATFDQCRLGAPSRKADHPGQQLPGGQFLGPAHLHPRLPPWSHWEGAGRGLPDQAGPGLPAGALPAARPAGGPRLPSRDPAGPGRASVQPLPSEGACPSGARKGAGRGRTTRSSPISSSSSRRLSTARSRPAKCRRIASSSACGTAWPRSRSRSTQASRGRTTWTPSRRSMAWRSGLRPPRWATIDGRGPRRRRPRSESRRGANAHPTAGAAPHPYLRARGATHPSRPQGSYFCGAIGSYGSALVECSLRW